MEMVEGESLAARLEREPRLPAAEAARIAANCARALHAAHRVGTVHRNLKPTDIVLTPSGGVQLSASEYAYSFAGNVRSDLYALGLLLYRMLAGRPPFRAAKTTANTPEFTTSRAHTNVPEQLPVDVPPALARLCLRLLAWDPAERPPSGAYVAASLEAPGILDPWPASPKPRPAAATAQRWAVARRAPQSERAVTVAAGPLVLFTAAAAVALCLASAQRPLDGNGGGHRVQVPVSAPASQVAGSSPSPAGSGPSTAPASPDAVRPPAASPARR
jgi:serine/threonine-protein kinase